MTRWTVALAMGAVLTLAGCATGYGPKGATGGYTDERLDDAHYRVKFNGNGYASQERVWSFWIYRCAEITKQQGYAYFRLQKPGEPLSMVVPAVPRSMAMRADERMPSMVKTATRSAPVYVYVPGGTTSITTWSTDAVVAMYRDPLPVNVFALRAQTVLDELGPYVKSNGTGKPPTREELVRHALTVDRIETGFTFGGQL